MKYEGWAVGQQIRNLRNDAQLTIEQLSEIVDKSVSHISQLEQGGRKMSIDLLFELAEALNTDANTILGIHIEKSLSDKNEEDEKKVSIDEAMRGLSPNMRNYLQKTFLNMINDAENLSKCQ